MSVLKATDLLRTRVQALLAKIETTPGTDANPTGSADAIQADGPVEVSFNPDIADSQEIVGTLDAGEFDVGLVPMQVSFPVALKGSGTAGTAGQLSALLRACGFEETTTGTPVPATGTTTATGGTTSAFEVNTATDTDWSTTDGAYVGMPVTLSGNPAAPVTTFITGYTVESGTATVTVADEFSSALDTSTEAVIPENVRYAPASDSLPALTLYVYIDGVLYKGVGTAGDVSVELSIGQRGRAQFTFTGLFESVTDAAVPVTTVESTRPPVWKDGRAVVNRLEAGLSAFSLNAGNTIEMPPNPNAAEGMDPAEITGRNFQGSVDPNHAVVATDARLADFRAGTKVPIAMQCGSGAGNRYAVVITAAKYRDHQAGDRNGIATQTLPFSSVSEDDGTFLTIY